MKLIYILNALVCFLLSSPVSLGNSPRGQFRELEPADQVLELSKKKWTWMMDRQIDSLADLFHDNMISREPSIKTDKPGQLDGIANGNTQYDHIDIIDTDIHILGDTAILLTKVAFNYSMNRELEIKGITEIYQKYGNVWKLILIQTTPV